MSDYEDGYLAHQNSRPYSGNVNNAYQTGKALGSLLRGGGRVGGDLFSTAGPVMADMLAAAPLLALAFLLTAPLDFLAPLKSLPRVLAVLAVGYCFFALVYFIKGLALGCRLRGGLLWLLPLLLLALVVVLLPALQTHQFIVRVVPNVPAVSAWGPSLVFVVVAFLRYRFTTDFAPFYVLWAYRLGYGWTKK